MCDSYPPPVPPADQVRWGVDYIREHYGLPGSAPESYANGGILPNGPTIVSNETDEPIIITRDDLLTDWRETHPGACSCPSSRTDPSCPQHGDSSKP